jgi:hypothetical protein
MEKSFCSRIMQHGHTLSHASLGLAHFTIYNHTTQQNPKILAYTVLEGTFDYNKTPLAPPGMKVIIYEKLLQQKTWDPHGTNGWYLSPTMEHYCCNQAFTNKTKAGHITDTVEFISPTYNGTVHDYQQERHPSGRGSHHGNQPANPNNTRCSNREQTSGGKQAHVCRVSPTHTHAT